VNKSNEKKETNLANEGNRKMENIRVGCYRVFWFTSLVQYYRDAEKK
jgi:hypothetical protein